MPPDRLECVDSELLTDTLGAQYSWLTSHQQRASAGAANWGKTMKQLTILNTVAVVLGLGLVARPVAAQTPATTLPASPSGGQPMAAKPAEACMSAVRTFTAEISRQGYWIGRSDYGYGYPMGG